MQLSKINISGFKSFVDPTTIELPSKLIAVVGPNGCGKSNIIDASRWVMGESSSKQLRGESSIDVIFNGSQGRKPVGQASVELIFDNSCGTIGGEYAKFAEISVKRTINREADSTYYLNGVRCRKRDISDIFLGTGLGPRSYAIIGQNMITQVIEAKPDDLRTYIEEAAGISKYKERRHETELRINHTKENLARVNDLCIELDKQLSHLKHQANVAEKFKVLKQQERVLRAELYGAQWRQYDGRLVEVTLEVQREETALEGRQSELSGTDRNLEQIRHEQRVAQDAFQEVQRRYYAVGNEITRIEQDVLHHQERQSQWENDLSQTEKDYSQIKEQIEEAEEQSRELAHEIQSVEPQLSTIDREADSSRSELSHAEQAMQEWQMRWDEFNESCSKTAQTAQVEQTRIQHVEQNCVSLQRRHEQLQQDQNRINVNDLSQEIEELSHKAEQFAEQAEGKNQQLVDTRQEISSLQSSQQESNQRLDTIRSELQRLRGQQASLEALQQTALGQRDNATTPWAAKYNLGDKPRLAQQIEVEAGWEFAVEKVLGFCLQAICVDKLSDVANAIDDLKSGNLCIFANDPTAINHGTAKHKTLQQMIKTELPINGLLAGVYVADNLDEALAMCASLDNHESIVTRDGVWLNRSWLKILREKDPAAGVFQREQELKKLATQIEELQQTKEELEAQIEERSESIKRLEQEREQLQQVYNQVQAQSAQVSAQEKAKRERLTELKMQAERFAREQQDCIAQLSQAQTSLAEIKEVWQEAMARMEEQADVRESLTKERDEARSRLNNMREVSNQKKERKHELQLRLETAKSQKASLVQSVSRMQSQMAQFNERRITLQSELSSMPSLDGLKANLSRSLDKHVGVESELNKARSSVESLDQDFRNLETSRQAIERDINKVRNKLEASRVELQGLKVKAETIAEQIKETEFTLEGILKDMPQDINVDEWQEKLDQVVQRIGRLGPINLVAIEEYATCSERKTYLDKQMEDLNGGLVTLEEAIAKIDRETRARFKETFDKVNSRFQELFPTIFGGGKAYLELTEEDLLTAGVTMMACPPGKRNSTIYLLSGGEKSLTAIALIFSIFHLNPAPFCMLDEVDAALDDANVIRFANLVRSMADKTQFIFISHNKIAIEMGQHLIGVTMHEPGVSRLVSVDIEKAIDLAGA